MNLIWGQIIAAVGALFITWGRTKSDFGLHRLSATTTLHPAAPVARSHSRGLLVARSRVLWGDRVHGFYQVAGALMIIAGPAIALTG